MIIRAIARLGVASCLCILLFGSIWPANSPGQQPQQKAAPPAGYVYKPLRPTGWGPPMKPFIRLADVKAQHKGEKEWSEWVVKDEHLWSQSRVRFGFTLRARNRSLLAGVRWSRSRRKRFTPWRR
jgi:hypothetical protein